MADWLVSWIGGLIVSFKLNNNYWKEGHTKSHWYNADDCQQLGWRIAQAERTHFQLLQQATRGDKITNCFYRPHDTKIDDHNL
uniref:Uncharacterized protein n=1 Tax=Glossina palpalis gambiensis TaxID=67801 RepID=A0A1B0BKX3_9MUSC